MPARADHRAMIRQVELVERVSHYDPNVDEDMLNRAYVFSMQAHGSQKRASGDPYFSHPLEVAGILTGMKLDTATIATALLHDTIEDTLATYQEIERRFGPEIARLVDGVTKLSRLEQQSDRARQAENFRKLLLAMSSDIRVLLVKLADRLHNMRTLRHIPDAEKRRRIALETMEIYAPLAERIGMQEIKDELEDLAFAELNPEARQSVTTRLDFLREQGGGLVDRITDQLKRTLAEAGVETWVSGRQKRPYSIWRKMERKNISFEQLSDIMAFRIVVEDVEACYRALGVVHSAYRMVPGRFKDYISTPKPNGYRSLHTTVIGPERQRIEVQIRTREMHEVADLGVAAHWQYKQQAPEADSNQYRWLRELLEILEHASDPEEFLEHTKLSMFQDQVFCFTPKGDLINLPRGATPVDFAYAVHSDVGDTCVGVKINGRLVPLRTELQNGDQVEILRSKTQTPSPTWENFVVTGKARSRIRRFIRNQQRSQYIDLGKAIMQKAFRDDGHVFSEKALDNAIKVLKQKAAEDLYAAVGDGTLTGRAVLEAVFPGEKQKEEAENIVPLARARARQAKGGAALPIRGLIPGMALHFAGCCHPLPGDRIVGIVSTGKGVTIHTIDCETLEQFVNTPERWLDVGWDTDQEHPEVHVGRIATVVTNEPGSLSSLSTVIAKNHGNIINLKITNRSPEFFEMIVDIEVRDLKHLTNIIAALRADPAISSVERARG
ncbi:MAG TPA: bifunctional (p)ppGpp synthetase/guanosine-3',5'-bis(diphosphate) 3'-pyrophosphohydrolase [Candidatus Sulfotelmatobacter sp.]|nr:bifunctional (p)ppGpp synthetase/guanosine-3',5'-bis(diphosphate) 3'-pyrophosphohydrolase [Candidatus Sulfotelmatobacter sp.]